MSRICARCGKNLDLVGTAHNCLPMNVSDIKRGLEWIARAEEKAMAQPKPEKKAKRKR